MSGRQGAAAAAPAVAPVNREASAPWAWPLPMLPLVLASYSGVGVHEGGVPDVSVALRAGLLAVGSGGGASPSACHGLLRRPGEGALPSGGRRRGGG